MHMGQGKKNEWLGAGYRGGCCNSKRSRAERDEKVLRVCVSPPHPQPLPPQPAKGATAPTGPDQWGVALQGAVAALGALPGRLFPQGALKHNGACGVHCPCVPQDVALLDLGYLSPDGSPRPPTHTHSTQGTRIRRGAVRGVAAGPWCAHRREHNSP